MAKQTTDDLLKKIKKSNSITESQVKLLTKRKNDRQKFNEEIFWDGEILLTKDQVQKAKKWLMNLYKSPSGKERSNNPFGYREQLALETLSYMQLKGWYDAGNFFRSYWVPLYVAGGENASFEYYVWGGKINIVG